MAKREISNLDLKIKLTKEYLDNSGYESINHVDLLQDLIEVKSLPDGKVDPDSVSPLVNAFMGTILGDHMLPPYFDAKYISEYKSTLQKSNSFIQENIDTKKQFDKVYAEYKTKTDTIFRGQREAKWRLYSKLQRHWIEDKMFERWDSYEHFVERLVELGKAKYSQEINALLNKQNIDTVNDISVLGYLQHHSCPTPMLDWTYKFQNALYFAIDGLTSNTRKIEIEDYCSVYFIEEKYVEGSNLRIIMEEAITKSEQPMLLELIAKISKGDKEKRRSMERHFAGRQLIDRKRLFGSGFISHMTKISNLIHFPIGYFSDKDIDSGIIFSLNNSKNILNQAGVFTWNSDPSKPIEMVGDESYKEGRSEEDARNYSFCNCFNINKSLAVYIRQRLESDGITKEYIYPTPELTTWDVFEESKVM